MANNKYKIIGKIISLILNVLLIIVTIIIAIGFYYIYQIKIKQNDYANLFGYTFFEVATGSMNPTIQVGDVIVVKITKQIKENDIIVYKDGKSIITHRLIKKESDELIAKGDANNSEDKPIQENMILGRVVKIIPKLGIWRKILTSPEIVGLIIVLIIIFSLVFMNTSKPEGKHDE